MSPITPSAGSASRSTKKLPGFLFCTKKLPGFLLYLGFCFNLGFCFLPEHPYQDWLQHHGLPPATDSLEGSDRGGIRHLLECAFGSDPVTAHRPPERSYEAAPPGWDNGWPWLVGSPHGLPAIEWLGGGILEAGWWEEPDARQMGRRYFLETSGDLRHWTPVLTPTKRTWDRSAEGRVWTTVREISQLGTTACWMRVRGEMAPAAHRE